MGWWKNPAPAPVATTLVFPEMVRRVQELRHVVRQLTAETLALSLQLTQLEAHLIVTKEHPALMPEEFSYEHRQRGDA